MSRLVQIKEAVKASAGLVKLNEALVLLRELKRVYETFDATKLAIKVPHLWSVENPLSDMLVRTIPAVYSLRDIKKIPLKEIDHLCNLMDSTYVGQWYPHSNQFRLLLCITPEGNGKLFAKATQEVIDFVEAIIHWHFSPKK